MKTVFLVVGRTASGKDSIVKKVAEDLDLQILKSYATRPIRVDDPKDIDAHTYIKPEQVEQYRQRMIAYTKIGEYEYFATIDQLRTVDFYIIDPQGIEFMRQYSLDDVKLCVVYIYVPEHIRRTRALEIRGDGVEVFEKRNKKEQLQFNKFEENKDWDYMIMNTNLEDSIQILKDIINKERGDLFESAN